MRHIVFVLMLVCGILASTASRADLLISPLRIVFEDRTRSATVTLMNPSSNTSSYRVDWRWYKMNESGMYEEVPEIDRHGVIDFRKAVRFSPRQITIAPTAKQTIRLSLRRPDGLPDGEYRAHLAFTRLAQTKPPTPPQEGGGAHMRLDINMEFSIPVIIRQGNPEPNVSINTAQYIAPTEKAKYGSIDVTLSHSEDYSTYGKLHVYEGENSLGYLNNISLFPEISKRSFQVSLDKPIQSPSDLRIVYEGDQEYRGTILAEQQIK